MTTKSQLKLTDFLNADGDFPASVAADMNYMHLKYDVYSAIRQLDREKLYEFFKFRLGCLREELEETELAFQQANAEEIVDGIIDLVVFAVGTLDLFGVDFDKAWREVLRANLNKQVGIKEGRDNPFGLPDLVKPSEWSAPSHAGNHGKLATIFDV